MGNNLESVELVCEGLEALPSVAEKIIEFAGDERIWRFEGEMGSGKTTLITALAKRLGVVDSVSSPTFSLVNEYRDEEDRAYYHFDFYRIKDEMEAMDIGVEEYFDSGDICMLEWASLIPSLMPEDYLMVEIVALDDGVRKIKLWKCHE
ncbi:tRNA (adenosine(37)-N6)-threonylcarbamoyltransferase complex ATPase subunit type 1 TsaE [Fulvitalea axinellae]|uniref:tRNA threonylcarbamoyladenosine biosynthesis protein TsaE n=1 Tax=Fulvitalea axinellae TaxID=1182444 RepID=A0AAU9DDM0_9BACT|nr:tRNA (adenosine(37)-N6)-threonylcarbamoyltransferase complex ATPase subunit type 1 TsaE [Fulvitalea axinellae]